MSNNLEQAWHNRAFAEIINNTKTNELRTDLELMYYVGSLWAQRYVMLIPVVCEQHHPEWLDAWDTDGYRHALTLKQLTTQVCYLWYGLSVAITAERRTDFDYLVIRHYDLLNIAQEIGFDQEVVKKLQALAATIFNL